MRNQITAFYDGECPMCSAGIIKFQSMASHAAVKFVDLHSDEAKAAVVGRFTSEDLMREMIVQMPDTTYRIGYFAWIAILKYSSRFSSIANLMNNPLLYSIGPAIYKLVATNRLLMSKVMRLPKPCANDMVCHVPISKA